MKKLTLFAALALVAPNAGAMNLTAVSTFGLNANDTTDGVEEWLTTENSPTWNMYVQSNGQFLNSGNGAGANIDVPLVMGSNVFTVYADGAAGSRYGMAFMFNHMDTAPQIAAAKDAGSPAGAFNVIDASRFVIDRFGAPRQSPGSIVYTDGIQTATLTEFTFSNGSQGGADLVSEHDLGANGRPDNVGSFTLEVETVPEPAAAWCLSLGVVALLKQRKR